MSENKTVKSNSFWVPIAIIIAGFVIAGAVVYSGNVDNSDSTITGSAEQALSDSEDTELEAPEPGTEVFDVSVDDDPMDGSKNAKVIIVEFSDYECPYCQRNSETIKKIRENYSKDEVAIVYRDFPLDFHPDAQKAAEAAECAGEQNMYWEYHDKLFANQENLSVDDLKKYAKDLNLKTATFNKCLDSGEQTEEIENDMSDGANAEVTGTPATFINGRKISGAYPYEDFEKIIEEELVK